MSTPPVLTLQKVYRQGAGELMNVDVGWRGHAAKGVKEIDVSLDRAPMTVLFRYHAVASVPDAALNDVAGEADAVDVVDSVQKSILTHGRGQSERLVFLDQSPFFRARRLGNPTRLLNWLTA